MSINKEFFNNKIEIAKLLSTKFYTFYQETDLLYEIVELYQTCVE